MTTLTIKPKLIPAQERFLKHSRDKGKFAFCGGIGVGKTYIASIFAIARGMKYGENAICSSQSYGACKKVFLAQVEKLLKAWEMPYDFNRSDLILTLPSGAKLYGASSESLNGLTGLTDISNFICDESAIMDNDARLFLEDRCRGVDLNGHKISPKYRYIGSSPLGKHTGWFKEFIKTYPEKVVFAPTLEAVEADFMPQTMEWYQERIESYGGLNSPICRAQFLAEIIDDGDVTNVFKENFGKVAGDDVDYEATLGVDASGDGDDKWSFAVVKGNSAVEIKRVQFGNGKQMADIAEDLMGKWGVKHIQYDSTGGFSCSFKDVMEDRGHNDIMSGVNFGQKAVSEDYLNARTEMYIHLANNPILVDDKFAQEEASFTHWFVNSKGKRALESKESIKKALQGRSPDTLDSIALACYYKVLSPKVVMDYESLQQASAIFDLC